VFLLALSALWPAKAADPEPPARAPIASALTGCREKSPDFTALFNEAEALMKTRTNLSEALALYRLADATCSSMLALEGQAQVHLAMGNLYAAYDLFRQVGEYPSPNAAEYARAMLDSLDAKLKEQRYAVMVLRFSPAHAEVLVDDFPITGRPGQLVWKVAPGVRKVVVRAPGYVRVEERVLLEPNGTLAREYTLPPR
jgi:hypothetical protein